MLVYSNASPGYVNLCNQRTVSYGDSTFDTARSFNGLKTHYCRVWIVVTFYNHNFVNCKATLFSGFLLSGWCYLGPLDDGGLYSSVYCIFVLVLLRGE